MSSNNQIEQLVLYLKNQDRAVSASELVQVLGITPIAESFCQRIIEGLLGNDQRVNHIPEKGWSSATTPFDQEYLSDHDADCLNQAVEPHRAATVRPCDKESPVAVVVRMDGQPSTFGIPQFCGVMASVISRENLGPSFGPTFLVHSTVQFRDEFEEGERLPWQEGLLKFREFLGEQTLVSWRGEPVRVILNTFFLYSGIEPLHQAMIPLSKLAHFLNPDISGSSFSQWLTSFGWRGFSIESPRYEVEVLEEIYHRLADALYELYGLTPLQWLIREAQATADSLLSLPSVSPQFLESLPALPGVYSMLDRRGAVIYIGKSKNLKNRISGYFLIKPEQSSKMAGIHHNLDSIGITLTGSELAAEILEATLITRHRPRFNTMIDLNDPEDSADDFFLLLPGPEPNDRIIHLVNSRHEYLSLTFPAGSGDVPGTIKTIEAFFSGEVTTCSPKTESGTESDFSRVGGIIMPRWWRRYRDTIPRYERKYLTAKDLLSILSTIRDEEFSPDHRYQ